MSDSKETFDSLHEIKSVYFDTHGPATVVTTHRVYRLKNGKYYPVVFVEEEGKNG